MHNIRTNTPCNPTAVSTIVSGQQRLNTLIFNPLLAYVPVVFINQAKVQQQKDCLVKADKKLIKKGMSKQLAKHLFQLGAVSLLALPAKSLLANNSASTFSKVDEVVANKEIVVATLDDSETVFQEGEFVHGFGYDVAKRYADHLGVPMRLKTYADKDSLILALKNGEADMALGVETTDQELSTNLVACNATTQNKLEEHGLDGDIGFTFLRDDKGLIDHSSSFLCSQEQLGQTQAVARFYDRTLLKNNYSEHHFKRAMTQKLPLYEHAFKAEAGKHDHDWQLLAAISYQESHLNPDAISPTGVQGLMMLTQDTAKEMGISDRTDAVQSIQGGAKYLKNVYEMFDDVPEAERLWFVLASYNMGPNAVKRIQDELKDSGKNPHSWSDVYVYLSQNADKNSRYVQCMHYVTNIRTYLEEIKTTLRA